MFRVEKCFIFLILLITSVLLLTSSSFAVNTNLTIQDVECYYTEEFVVSVQLTDESGFPLNSKKVAINIDGRKFDNLYTDANGKVDLKLAYDENEIWYDVGTYKISASFLGSEGYNSSSSIGKVTILQMPTKMTMNYDKNNKKVFFSLLDKNNIPAGFIRIDFYINNKFYEYTLTDEFGRGSIDISHLSPGEYLISANINEFLDNYVSDNSSMKIEVKKSNSFGKSENSYSKPLAFKDSKPLAFMEDTGLPIMPIIFSFLVLFSSLFYYKKK